MIVATDLDLRCQLWLNQKSLYFDRLKLEERGKKKSMKINICGCIHALQLYCINYKCVRDLNLFGNGGDRLSYVSATPIIIITIIIDSLSQGTASVLAGEVGDTAEAPCPEIKIKRLCM